MHPAAVAGWRRMGGGGKGEEQEEKEEEDEEKWKRWDDGTQVAGVSKAGFIVQHSARSKHAGGKKSLRVRVVQIPGHIPHTGT
jgi:hypothetical protein